MVAGETGVALRSVVRIEDRTTPALARRDYLSRTPVYRYVITACGHTVAYRQRLRTGGWAWCRDCARPWRFTDGSARELPPTVPRPMQAPGGSSTSRGPRAYREGQLALLWDEAILKGRIADRAIRADAGQRWTLSRVRELAAEFGPALAGLYRRGRGRSPSLAAVAPAPAAAVFVEAVLADHGIGKDRVCAMAGCAAWQHAGGLCERHYRAARRAHTAVADVMAA